MFFHDLFEVFLRNVVPNLVHSSYNVLAGDLTRVICVELVKDCLQFVVVKECLHIQGSHEEFCIVYLFVTEVVNLVDYPLDFVLGHLDVALLNRQL